MKGILPLSFTIQVIDTTPLYVYTFIHFGVKIIYSLFFFFSLIPFAVCFWNQNYDSIY